MGGKIKKWTEEDILFIKENSYHKSSKEIARLMGRTLGSISTKLAKLNLTKVRKSDEDRKWHKIFVLLAVPNFGYNETAKHIKIIGKMDLKNNQQLSRI